jgi:hypothetical protein
MILSLRHILQPPITASLLGPNILLSFAFSDTFYRCYFLTVSDEIRYPY